MSSVREFQWLVIPHGRGPAQEGRLNIRVMPDVEQAGNSAPALRNWPAWLTSGVTAELVSPVGSATIDLSEAWNAQIGRIGISSPDAGRIWELLFDEMPKGARPPSAGELRPGFDHVSLAAGINQIAGGIYASSLVSVRSDDKRRSAASDKPGILQAPNLTPRTSALAGLTDFYTSAFAPRVRPLRERSRSVGTASGRVYEDLIEDMLFVQGIPGQYREPAVGPEDDFLYFSPGTVDTIRKSLDPDKLKSFTLADTMVATFGIKNIQGLDLFRHAGKDRGAPRAEPLNGFHRSLGALSAHPWLMRSLGLVVEVTLSESLLQRLGASTGNAQLALRVKSVTKDGRRVELMPAKSPWTKVCRSFYPEVKTTSTCSICMPLRRQKAYTYQVTQVGVDASAEKLFHLAQRVRTEADAAADAAQSDAKLAADETGGLSLLCRDAHKIAALQRVDMSTLATDEPATLWAENLIIGYKPDVQVFVRKRGWVPRERATTNEKVLLQCEGDGWGTLVGRSIAGVTISDASYEHLFHGVRDQEGWVSSTRQMYGADDKKGIIAHQELFAWQNWNLSVPSTEIKPAPDAIPQPDKVPFANRLRVRYAAAQGLAEQRIGWGYRLGLRAVFADSESATLDEAKLLYGERDSVYVIGHDELKSGVGPIDFLRAEPVGAPQVHLAERPRSQAVLNEDARHMAVAMDRHGDRNQHSSRRLLVPSRISLELAIRLGMFDDPALRLVPARSALGGFCLTNEGDVPTIHNSWLCSLLGYAPAADESKATEDTILARHPGAVEPRVPYLPDPWATRMLIAIYRKHDECLLYLDYFDVYDDHYVWPNCKVLRVELLAVELVKDQVRGIQAELDGDTLTVKASRGEELVLRAWFEMDDERLQCSSIVHQLALSLDNDLRKIDVAKAGLPASAEVEAAVTLLNELELRPEWQLRQAMPVHRRSALVRLLSHWNLNPPVEIELVHAVGQPLRAPTLSQGNGCESGTATAQVPRTNSSIELSFAIARQRSETVGQLQGDIVFSRKSTSKVEVSGAWRLIEELAGRPTVRSGAFSAMQIEGIPGIAEHLRAKPNAPAPVELPPENDILRLGAVDAWQDACTPTWTSTIDRTVELESTKARVVSVTATGTTRQREMYKNPRAETSTSSSTRRVIVPATEPPDKPAVDYVVPLLEWNGTNRNDRLEHRREGGWFRIWLRDGWHSSGNGELMALVCWPTQSFDESAQSSTFQRWRMASEPAAKPCARIEQLITRWGLDPLWTENIRFGHIPAGAFTNRIKRFDDMEKPQATDEEYRHLDWDHLRDVTDWAPTIDLGALVPGPACTADEDPDQRVRLALYLPQFDRHTDRWFVDIHIDPQAAYFPFVRLALARYQPYAMAGCHLSEIEVAEYVQLLPTRIASVTVTKDSRDPRRHIVGVHVVGSAPFEPASAAERVRVENELARPNRTCMRMWLEHQPSDWAKDLQDQTLVPDEIARFANSEVNGGWVPHAAAPEANPVTMKYQPNSRTWTGGFQFEASIDRRYSLYIEESEPILQDPESDFSSRGVGSLCFEENEQKVVLRERVVFSDRLLLFT